MRCAGMNARGRGRGGGLPGLFYLALFRLVNYSGGGAAIRGGLAAGDGGDEMDFAGFGDTLQHTHAGDVAVDGYG